MLLPLHVFIALAGVTFATLLYIAPSSTKLKITYGLTGLTVATGTWLIVIYPAHMVQSCLMGLAFLGFTFTCIILARNKLAAQNQEINKR